MSNKHVALSEFGNNNSFDILCLGEHWCKKDEIVFSKLDDYVLANSFCRLDYIRGGVSIYVKDELASKCNNLDIENICIELDFEATGIVFNCLKLVVVSLYRSPNGCPMVFLEKIEELFMFLSRPSFRNFKIVVGGDLNAEFDLTVDRTRVHELKNILRQFNFSFCNVKPTRGTACLDNIFKNMDLCNAICDVSKFPFSDHDCVWIKLGILNNTAVTLYEPNKLVTSRPVTEVKIINLRNSLISIDWFELLYCIDDCETAFKCFVDVFIFNFELFIPKKTCKVNNTLRLDRSKFKTKNSNWYTPELAKMKSMLMLYLDVYRNNQSEMNKSAYVRVRNLYKLAINEAKKQYNFAEIEASSNKCKKAWNIINSVAKDRQSDHVSPSPDDFNSYFIHSVDEVHRHVGLPTVSAVNLIKKETQSTQKNFVLKEISPQVVNEIVNKFKSSNSVDVYDLSSNLVKRVVDCFAQPLTYCINKCLVNGVFPEILKVSRVVPVYKKGPTDCPSSYRPISLIPIFSKIFESVIHKQLLDYINEYNIISDAQFGFVKGRSTVGAINVLIKKVLGAFENKNFAQATFCDLSKAFDCVEHTVLLDKLAYYGVQGCSLSLFKSYLCNRKQIVSVRSVRSGSLSVKYGVPQGSVLGPLLFVLMINDLPSFLTAHTILYADDTTFLHCNIDLNTLKLSTEDTLSQAAMWFKSNGFMLNENKTQHMIFSLRDLPLDHSLTSVKFLGVHIDGKLTWETHIDYICGRISRVIYLLKQLKNHVPEKYVRSAYFSFFQSVILYGILIWGNSSHVNKILLLQKKIVRILTNSHWLAHCRPLFIDYKIMTVVNLYIYTVLLYVKENHHNLQLRHDIHSYNTRGMNQINIPHQRLSKSLNSYDVLGLKLYNKLPDTLTSDPVNRFKIRLFNWLIVNPFYSLAEFFENAVDL